MNQKPPLGITPKYIYEIHRVQEICRALNDYAQSDLLINYYDLMLEWTDELKEKLDSLKKY